MKQPVKRRTRGIALLLSVIGVLLLPACASASREGAAVLDTGPDASPRSPDTEAEASQEPLASDPYVRRPTGLGGSEDASSVVRFESPGDRESSSQRPRYTRPISVGVALVHEAVFANPATLLLELEANLTGDEGVRRVVALRKLAGESLTLEQLCALAVEQGHDALLVDVLPGKDGAQREGYWLYPAAPEGERLIAHVVIRDAESEFVGMPTFPDVWDRLAAAHWRLPVPKR